MVADIAHAQCTRLQQLIAIPGQGAVGKAMDEQAAWSLDQWTQHADSDTRSHNATAATGCRW